MLCTLTLPLPSAVGHSYYTTFYLLAFAVQLVLLLRAGYRRGYPLQTWLVLLAASTLAFIVGTKLITLPAEAWPGLLHGLWPYTTARSVLGGGLGFAVVLLLLRRWLGFSWHVADAFAGPLCAGLVVQCVGCLLTGCCFGMPTDGSWGFTYASGTLPYQLQLQYGLLEPEAAHSLAVHPTQLYTLLLCAGVWLTLHLTRHRNWPAGSWALLQAGLLVAGRLLVDFWRDPAGEPIGDATVVLGSFRMLQLQWLLLPGAVLLLGGWGWLVYWGKAVAEEVPVNRPVRNLLGVVGVLGFAALLPAGALTFPELLVVKAVLLTVVAMATSTLLQGALAVQRTGLPLAALAVILLFTNQVPAAEDQQEKYTTLSASVSTGEFERLQNTQGSGCGSSSPLLPYRHRHTVGTLDLARTRTAGTDEKGIEHKADVTFGVRLHVGVDQQTAIVPDSVLGIYPNFTNKRTTIGGFNPYFQADRRFFGLGLGLLLGPLGYHRPRSGDQVNPGDMQVSLRLGPREWAFGQFDFNYLGYSSANPQHRIGLGTGFGSTRWQLLGGATLAKNYQLYPGNSRWSGFAEARGQLNTQWGASGFLTLGNASQRQLGFRLSRRLSK